MVPQRNVNGNGPATNKTIPRSLPVQPPPSVPPVPSVQDQLLRLKRRGLLLGIGLAGFLLVAVGAFLFFRTGDPGTAPAKDPETVKSAGKDAKGRAEKPGSLKMAPEAGESLVPKKFPSPFPAGESKGREPYLETIGGLSAVHLYQTYLNIGLLADAVENETYTNTEAVNVMLTVTELLNLVAKQLGKVPSSGLTGEDEAALESIRHLTGLLRTQSNALLGYWASGEEMYANRYQGAREQSWNAIKEMMGLED